MDDEEPFDIDVAMRRIRDCARGRWEKAALFQLADEGYDSPFEQLTACIISIRTRDETTVTVARRLFRLARTVGEMIELSVQEIDAAIRESTYHEAKAPQIRLIAEQIAVEYGGEVPCDRDVLMSFRGIGPKCANLVMGIACGHPHIGVDVHVHRITNRWGYVETHRPMQTLKALEHKLPKAYWLEINELLVPFGKNVCTGLRPKCSACPVRAMCRQRGVTTHR